MSDEMMREKGYYSVRTGKNAAGVKLDLAALKKLFLSFHHQFGARDYFQEAFGYNCVDQGDVTGTLGEDIDGVILLALRKDNLWPLTKIDGYREDDLFDMIEFFYDQVSKPLEGHYHSFSGCGMHYSTFDRDAGRAEYRAKLNPLLASYADGYQLSDVGEIMALPDDGMAALTRAPLPHHDPNNVEGRVQAAINRFLRYRASIAERKTAVRELADVLE